MAIILASIEDNGWVLAVRSAWSEPVGYSAFALDPDGAPKVALTVHSAGHDRVGDEAVYNPARPRQIVATKPVRKPWPDHAQVFEIDHGDGTRTVRLALSERIYADDVIVSCQFAAGWHTGEVAETPAVTNNSTREVPLPIVRLASPQWQMIEGPGQRFDLIVASHHPEHHGAALHQAVAAVKFTATDGTDSNDVWVTELSTSTVFGDNLRCFGLDPVASGLFDGLNPGGIVTQWTVYPWIGSPRTCGVKTPAEAWFASREIGPDQSFTCVYDPARTVYPRRYVYVDAASGSTVAANVTVAGNLAEAKAGTVAASISVAAQALYLQDITVPATNGFGAVSRSVAWTDIVLAPGVQEWGGQTIGATANNGAAGRIVIRGDPDDADPRANCIWRAGDSAISSPANFRQFWLEALTLELGGASLISHLERYFHVNDVTIRGRPGFENGTHLLHVADAAAGQFQFSATNARLAHYGTGLTGNKTRAGLLRNFESAHATNAVTHVTSRKVLNPGGATASGSNSFDFVNGTTDYMIWQCAAYWNNGLFTNPVSQSSGGVDEAVRVAVVASLAERSGSSTGRFIAFGSSNQVLVDSIFDGFSTAGNAINLHNDTPGKDLNHPNTIFINSWLDRNATKHDVFGMDGTKTAAWEILYGVGYRGNVNNNRIPSNPANFQYEYFGRGSTLRTDWSPPIGSNDYPKYANDLSSYGPESGGSEGAATAGNGDYRPDTGSPAIGRAGVSNLDMYLDGVTPRPAVGSAGALPPLVNLVMPEIAPESTGHVLQSAEGELEGAVPATMVAPVSSAILIMTGEAGIVLTGGEWDEEPEDCAPPARNVRVLRVRPD